MACRLTRVWLLALAACGPGRPSESADLSITMPVACIPELPGVTYHCGEFVVPETRDSVGLAVGPRTITLRFVVLAATKEPRQPDPILYLTDRPGVTAFAGLLRLAQYMDEGSDRDIVVLEQRGAGYSTPALGCPRAAEGDPAFAALRSCRDSLAGSGVDLGAYTTEQSVRDYGAFMSRLGAVRYNLYGQGFGASLALALVRERGAAIRAVVLDTPILPNESGDGRTLAALSRLLRRCRADADCGPRYPNAAAQFGALVEQLGRQPAVVGVERVTPDRFFSMVAGALTDQAKLGGIPAGLAAAARGDWTAADPLLQRGADIPEGVEMARLTSTGQALSFLCPGAPDSAAADTLGWPPPVVRLVEARARLRIGQCAVWSVPKRVERRSQPAAPDLPILVAVGEGDSTGAAAIVSTWPNATVMTAPATGDGSISQSCPRRVMRAFFAAPLSQPDRSCVNRMLPIRFSGH